MMRVAIVAALATGCVAPMGVGPGPVHIPVGRRAKAVASGGAGFGMGASREQFQADASARLQARSWFSIEGGLVYGTVRDRDGDKEVVLSSGMPYVRPTFHFGPVSVGAALSGMGIGGGGGGVAYGFVEPRVGIGGERWAVYASWLRLGSTAVSGSTIETSARHWRAGGDYYFDVGRMRLGLAARVTRADDSISYSPGEGSDDVGGRWDEEYTMGSVELRVMSHAF